MQSQEENLFPVTMLPVWTVCCFQLWSANWWHHINTTRRGLFMDYTKHSLSRVLSGKQLHCSFKHTQIHYISSTLDLTYLSTLQFIRSKIMRKHCTVFPIPSVKWLHRQQQSHSPSFPSLHGIKAYSQFLNLPEIKYWMQYTSQVQKPSDIVTVCNIQS